MSSSEQTGEARGFLSAFAATLGLLAAALAAALIVVDPLGAGDGNALCPAGAKTAQPSFAKFIIPERQQAQAAVIGTSRVHFAFDGALLDQIGGPATVNLGVAGALPADFAVLVSEMLASADSPDLYIGVDFNLAHQDSGGIPPGWWERASDSAASRLMAQYFNLSALRALPEAIDDCTVLIAADGTPVRDPSGFPLGLGRVPEDASILSERLAAADTDGLIAERLATFEAQLSAWQDSGAHIVLFAAPYNDEFRAMIAETGKSAAFDDYHRRLAAIAGDHNVPFLDFHSPDRFAQLDLPQCPEGGNQCHFYDLTHYDRSVAAAMAPFLREAMAEQKR